MMAASNKRLGLVLTGGGARAAYQAGVLRAVAEMGKFVASPFQVVTGVSAGAINSVFIAAHAHDFGLATKALWHFWERLRFDDVIDTGTLSFIETGARLIPGAHPGRVAWGREIQSSARLFATEEVLERKGGFQ